MHPEKPSRRTLLAVCLAGFLGWFGLGRQPAPAESAPAQSPAEDSQTNCIQKTRSTYDAEARCIRVEQLLPLPAVPQLPG